MKNYAYLDKGNILHIVESETSAKEYSKNGKVIDTCVPCKGGYPLIDDATDVVVYGVNEAYIGGNAKGGKLYSLKDHQSIANLYRALE